MHIQSIYIIYAQWMLSVAVIRATHLVSINVPRLQCLHTASHSYPAYSITSDPYFPFLILLGQKKKMVDINTTVSAPYYKILGHAIPRTSYFESIVWFGDDFRPSGERESDLMYTLAPLAWVCRGGRGCHINVRYVFYFVYLLKS